MGARQVTTWNWHGDDDCIAKGAGLTLRAERIHSGKWWWCVRDDARGKVADSNDTPPYRASSGNIARVAAEAAANQYLERL